MVDRTGKTLQPGRSNGQDDSSEIQPRPSDDAYENRPFTMIRGVSQLLFNYLPGRTVDWEDGLAIVKLGNVRLSNVWEPGRADVLLNEIGQFLNRWKALGGSVDPQFPDPSNERLRFAVGAPEAIEATILETAFLCQTCSALSFPKRKDLAWSHEVNNSLVCPSCGNRTLRQFGQVFVHGCGELSAVTEWLPASRTADDGSLEPMSRPLRCPNCGVNGELIMPSRSERVRDMMVICKRCGSTVVERFTARCPRCIRQFAKERHKPGTDVEATPNGDQTSDTIVSRIAMRMSRYSANDTYYPQTITMLRLDRPATTNAEDSEQHALRRLLPLNQRPESSHGNGETIGALAEMLSRAEVLGDEIQKTQILARIALLATTATSSSETKPDLQDDTVIRTENDIIMAIRESLAFRTRVNTRSAIEVSRQGNGASALLSNEILETQQRLGIREMLLVDDLPVITATFGYTRRAFTPTYEELSAHSLPTEVRVFPSLDRFATQSLGRPDLFGTVPILAREGEHQGLFISLDPIRVLSWLESNSITLPLPDEQPITRILSALEPVDRYYDNIWSCNVRRMIFGLVHSLSHIAMRSASLYSGLDRTSICEYIFLPLLGTVIFDNSSTFQLGGLESLVRDQLGAFFDAMANDAINCLYDSECIDSRGACHGCIHSPDISCRVFNHGLSRSFLIGGHIPWSDITKEESMIGYWQMGEN